MASSDVDQWDLFSALSRRDDPTTSHAAAHQVNARGAVLAILRALQTNGPGHADRLCELADPTGFRWQTYKAALSRAISAGWAEPNGLTQLSLLGRDQRVIRLTSAGAAVLAHAPL